MQTLASAYDQISDRALRCPISEIARIRQEVRKREKQGEKILDLSSGDIDPNLRYKGYFNAFSNSIKGAYFYPHAQGMPELREKIKDSLLQEGFTKLTLDDVCVTNGGIQSLDNIACITPDYNVLMHSPYWAPAFNQLVSYDKKVYFTTLTSNLELDLDHIKKWLKSEYNIGALMINSPNNPTGAIFSKKSLEELTDFAAKTNKVIIFDEAYHGLVYDQELDYSPSEFLDLSKSFLVRSFSKSHSLTGHRIGYVVTTNKTWMKALVNRQLHSTSGVSALEQAALAKLNLTDGIKKIRDAYQSKRDELMKLTIVNGFHLQKPPAGGIYLWLKVQIPHYTPVNSRDSYVDNLFKSFKIPVVGVPGKYFGPFNDEFIRLTFSIVPLTDLSLIVKMAQDKFDLKKA